jgi:hypothetical protein
MSRSRPAQALFRSAWITLLGLLAAGALLTGCGAPGGAGSSSRLSAQEANPARVTFVDYRTSVRMNLVNEAHTDPVKYYSEKRVTANTKVTSNEVLARMIEHFDDQGFSRYATAGFAPARGDAGTLQSLEIETSSGTKFLLNGDGVSEPARRAFRECRTAFMQIQELTFQAQAVENSGGNAVFQTPTSKHRNN